MSGVRVGSASRYDISLEDLLKTPIVAGNNILGLEAHMELQAQNSSTLREPHNLVKTHENRELSTCTGGGIGGAGALRGSTNSLSGVDFALTPPLSDYS